MKVLLQRVSTASVTVAGEEVAAIGAGLLLLVGFGHGDDSNDVARMARKIAGLRVFAGEDGRLQHALLDTGGAALVVPQFTLYGDTRKGRRPDFTAALAPAEAERLCADFARHLRTEGVVQVASGRFGAHMQVALVNDGPLTLLLEH